MRALPSRRLLARRIEVVSECASTSDEMRLRMANADEIPDLLLARHQSKGRGRKARDWWSGPAGVNLSFTLRMRPPDPAWCGGLLAACAIAACSEHYSGRTAALKWPNDVLLENGDGQLAKVGGLLAELPADFPDLLIGIGLNLNAAPPAEVAPYACTSVAAANPARANNPISTGCFLVTLLWELEKRWRRYLHAGPDSLEHEFLERLRVWAPNGVYAPDDSAMARGTLLEFSVRDGLTWGDSNPQTHPLGMLPELAKI